MSGHHVIKSFIKQAPETPGVYRMLDQSGNILYIGKAKNLNNRIAQYLTTNSLSERIRIMVEQISSIEIIECRSENEAILLEANLIKSLQPKYNILLKDDKSFPYILIREDHPFGQVLKHRGTKKIKGKYFGPFASINHLNKAIETIQKIFLLRTCTDHYFASRQRPCIQYEIKRCSAPCVGKINEEQYLKLIQQAEDFLEGKSSKLQRELKKKMEEASNNLQYEKAAEFRDRINALNSMQAQQSITANNINADFIAIIIEGNICCIEIFFFRGGQNFGNKAYFPEQIEDLKIDEILSIFISNFYQHNEVPEEIITSHQLAEEKQLSQIFNTKFSISKSGYKRKIIDFALSNAYSAINFKIKHHKYRKFILEELEKTLTTDRNIHRIDVFDNSHLFGKDAVSAMIVSIDGEFSKKHYRLYNPAISNSDNDYQMMQEAITRRYSKLLQEHPNYTQYKWPDLVIIDGGPAHLSIVSEIIHKNLSMQVTIIAIAKGESRDGGNETIYSINQPPLFLKNDNHIMKYIQNLRDEAHRFAITNHRSKRKKKNFESALDSILGIGSHRKKLLLSHFGTVQAIANASINELLNVHSIDNKLAERIFEYFRHK